MKEKKDYQVFGGKSYMEVGFLVKGAPNFLLSILFPRWQNNFQEK